MCQQRCEQESCGLEMVGREEREFPFRLIIIMGAEPTVVREREEPPEALDAKITSCIQAERLKLSHQANVWALCRRLKENYAAWAIGEIHLDNDMVAGEVLEQLSMINFEKSAVPLKAITLSCNDIVCDNLKHLRVAYLGTLVMLHLDHNRIGSDGCFYISKTNLPRLQTLDLSHNLLNDSAVGHLANTNLPKLLHLNVNNNQIGVPGLYSLSRAEWPSLALCQIKENSFQPDNQLDGIRFRSEVKLFRLELR